MKGGILAPPSKVKATMRYARYEKDEKNMEHMIFWEVIGDN